MHQYGSIWFIYLLDTGRKFNIHKMFRRFTSTAQKMKFSIKDFLSKCDQIRRFLRIWSHLLKKSLMENFIFCAVILCPRGRGIYRPGKIAYLAYFMKWCFLNFTKVSKQCTNHSQMMFFL